MRERTLTIPAHVDNLAEIRRFVREAAAALGAGPETICSLELAAEEAACNTIVHGYKGTAGLIQVAVGGGGDVLRIRLRDWAPPFDPTAVPDPDVTLPLEERPYGGMGLYLVRQSVDEMSYRPIPDGGNELTLLKRLH